MPVYDSFADSLQLIDTLLQAIQIALLIGVLLRLGWAVRSIEDGIDAALISETVVRRDHAQATGNRREPPGKLSLMRIQRRLALLR